MGLKRQKTKQYVTSLEIRDFAQAVYDYVWSKQYFISQGVAEKFAEGYSSRNSLKDELKVTHFTESIGKAVRLSQFLLRDYFSNILEFTIKEKHSFKKEVKLVWSHWLDNRNNIFVKVIDTLAIVAETFLFCDSRKLDIVELSEMTEWFIEWFEENLAFEFFKCGGWKNLTELTSKWYDELSEKLKIHLSMCYKDSKHPSYLKTIYSCKMIDLLRASAVQFPVPDGVLCDNCRLPTDQNLYRRIIYVRLTKEFQKISPLKRGDGRQKHINNPFDVNTEDQLNYLYPLKSEFIEKSNTKNCFPVLKEPKVKVHTGEISNTHMPLSALPNEASSAKDNFTVESNFENTLKSCTKDTNGSNFKQYQTSTKFSPHLRDGLTVQKVYLDEQNLHSKSHTEFSIEALSNTCQNIPSELVTEENVSKTNLNVEISGKAEIGERPISVLSEDSTDKTAALSLVASSHSEQVLSENFLSAPEILQPIKFQTKVPTGNNGNLKDTDYVKTYLYKSVTYEEFINSICKLVISKDFQVDATMDHNKLYLISEIFSNSTKEMFEAFCSNSIDEKLKNINISEKSVIVPENVQSERKSTTELDGVEVSACEYRYYFMGGKKDSPKKPKRRPK